MDLNIISINFIDMYVFVLIIIPILQSVQLINIEIVIMIYS